MLILLFRGLRALFFKLADNSEFVHDIFFEPREKRKTIKIFLSGVCGTVYGLLLLKFILYAFKIHQSFLFAVLSYASFASFFGVFCIFSVQFRCILMLILMEGCSKAGRNILKAFVLFLILTGAISNIVSNSKEIARVFECTTILTYNLTRTKFNLVVKPFTNAFARMDLSEVHASFQQITNVIHPIFLEVEPKRFVFDFQVKFRSQENISFSKKRRRRENLPEFYASNYKQKLTERCKANMEIGANECEKAFNKAFEDCLLKVPPIVNNFICLPLKIDFICGIESSVPNTSRSNVCDPSNVIDSKFGLRYVKLKEIERKFTAPYGDVPLNYTKSKELHAVKSISKKVDEKANAINAFVNFTCGFLIFVYFKVVYGKLYDAVVLLAISKH